MLHKFQRGMKASAARAGYRSALEAGPVHNIHSYREKLETIQCRSQSTFHKEIQFAVFGQARIIIQPRDFQTFKLN